MVGGSACSRQEPLPPPKRFKFWIQNVELPDYLDYLTVVGPEARRRSQLAPPP